MPSTETLTVFLVRHAESENNAKHTRLNAEGRGDWWELLRSPDPRLSALGRAQVARLEAWARGGADGTARRMRAAALADGGSRFVFLCSPMRRTLLTAQGLAAGLGFSRVTVDPECFEEGGCRHAHPQYADDKGLAALEAMTPCEVAAVIAEAKAGSYAKGCAGLCAATIADSQKLGEVLGLKPAQAMFVERVLPGMEHGWWPVQRSAWETRPVHPSHPRTHEVASCLSFAAPLLFACS